MLHNLNWKNGILSLAAVGIMSVFASSAFAEFPERPVQTIFPWGPGTAMAADQIIADAMSKELGVAVTPCFNARRRRHKGIQNGNGAPG